MYTLGVLDFFILFLLFVVSLAIGGYFAWKDRNSNTTEFLLGGKKMSPIPVTISLISSFLSSITILGWPAEIYRRGSTLAISLLASYSEVFLTAEVFLPIFYEINLTSIYKYLSERFQSNKLRVVVSVLNCTTMFPWLGIALYGPALALGAVTNLSISTNILLCGGICTIYTALGGLKAVIWTDVFQFVLMFAGILVVCVKGTIDVGGFQKVFEKAETGGRLRIFETSFDFYNSYDSITILLGTITLWTGGYSTSQMLIQRTLSMPNLAKAREVVYLSLPSFHLIEIMIIFMGLAMYAYYIDCDPIKLNQIENSDQLVPYYVAELFHSSLPGILGLFIACVFSSTLTTLSSALNAVSALVWDDWLKKFFPQASTHFSVIMAKIIATIAGLICIGVAFLASSVGTLIEASFALSGAPLGPSFAIFCLGIFFPSANAIGALSGFIVGQLACAWIIIGSLFNKRRAYSLETSIEGCARKNLTNIENTGFPVESLKYYQVEFYSPQGFNRIYHLSHFIIPLIGFLVAILVGLIVSHLFYDKNQVPNPKLLAPFLRKKYEKSEAYKKSKINKSSNENKVTECIPLN